MAAVPLRAPASAPTGFAFTVAGLVVEALAEGALWIGSARTLVVSDLHLEKGSAYAARGQLLPPYDTRATLVRIAALIARLRPERVVSLGDSFHDVRGPARMHDSDASLLASLMRDAAWIWIEGNHDPDLPASLGGEARETFPIGPLTLRHEPTGAAGEVAGHLHPCARVVGRGRSVRARCFATDGASLVMPAFGAFTGGLNVRDAAFAPIFPRGCNALMLGRARVYAAPPTRQVGD